MLERLLGVLVSHVALEVGGRELLELVLRQVLVVLRGHRDTGNDVTVLDRLKEEFNGSVILVLVSMLVVEMTQ